MLKNLKNIMKKDIHYFYNGKKLQKIYPEEIKQQWM